MLASTIGRANHSGPGQWPILGRPAEVNAIDGTAIVLCEGQFGQIGGKTAHGLVRHTGRYRVLAVIDSVSAGRDAGEMLDGRTAGIPVVRDLDEALGLFPAPPDYLVVGVATHGGVLPPSCRPAIESALRSGIHVDSGLHELLSEDPALAALARGSGARIRDVRRTPLRSESHGFALRPPTCTDTDSGAFSARLRTRVSSPRRQPIGAAFDAGRQIQPCVESIHVQVDVVLHRQVDGGVPHMSLELTVGTPSSARRV